MADEPKYLTKETIKTLTDVFYKKQNNGRKTIMYTSYGGMILYNHYMIVETFPGILSLTNFDNFQNVTRVFRRMDAAHWEVYNHNTNHVTVITNELFMRLFQDKLEKTIWAGGSPFMKYDRYANLKWRIRKYNETGEVTERFNSITKTDDDV